MTQAGRELPVTRDDDHGGESGPRRARKNQVHTVFPNLKHGEWQDSGHFRMIETPDRFNRALTDFVAGIAGY
jgi:hypothetical protein